MSTDTVPAAQTANDSVVIRTATVLDGANVAQPRDWRNTAYDIIAVTAAAVAVTAVAAVAAGAQIGITLACIAGALMGCALILRHALDVRRWIYRDPS